MPTHGKRIAYGRNQNRVSISTYPDDTSVPVRTSHWNQDPHDQAILGFTKVTATLASDVLQTKDDSSTYGEDDGSTYSRQSTLIEVVPQSGSSTDVIATINVIDTLENDILYLFKATESDTITIASGTPSVAGHIKTQLSGGATLTHDGVPIMLIRRGDYWYEFGADGAAVANTFTPTSSDTLSGKAISLTTNTLTGTSAELKTAISDETGSGLLVFGTAPTITLDNGTGLPAAGVVGTAAITGANTFTADQTIGGFDVLGVSNIVHDISTTTVALDFSADQLDTITVSATATFTCATYIAGASKTIKILDSGSGQNLAFPSGWKFVGTKPTAIAASKTAILTMTCFTGAESGVVAAYAVEE